jgi:hypothetical protein
VFAINPLAVARYRAATKRGSTKPRSRSVSRMTHRDEFLTPTTKPETTDGFGVTVCDWIFGCGGDGAGWRRV